MYSNGRQTFQNAGNQLIDPYTNAVLQNNQMLFEEQLRKRQIQQQQHLMSMQQLISNQNMILNSLMQQQGMQVQYQQPQKKPYQIQLKSITLKPLEYYSQQMSSIHYPPYQQPYPQRQAVPIPQSQQRVHDFKQEVPQRSIEVQTDDKITEFDKFQRMGLANSLSKQTIDNEWGPKPEEEKKVDDKKYQGDFELKIQREKQEQEKREAELKEKQYVRKRFKPPGMTKEQWAKINFKIFRDQFIYIALYFHRLRKSLESRKQIALNQKGELAIKCLSNFLEMFKKNCSKPIIQFSSNRENLNISDKRKILEEEMVKRKLNIKIQTKKLFSALMTNFNAKDITPETIDFLGSIMHEHEFPLQNFMFSFEVNRFNYTQFGALLNVTDIKAQCFLATLIILRVYIFRIVLKPWADFPDKIKKKELFEANCYIVGSLMYEIFMDYIKQNWLKMAGNQAHLPSKYKTYPRPLGPLLADRYQLPDDVAEVRQVRQLEEPLIMGLASREDLKSILEEDKPFCKEMEKYIQEWSQTVYKIVHEAYLQKVKQRRKERLDNKIKFIQIAFYSKPEEKERLIEQARQIYERYESILPQPQQETQ